MGEHDFFYLRWHEVVARGGGTRWWHKVVAQGGGTR
jgi:hypothetical protein